jgi:predicted DNA-binding transcriptional regulator YafY
MAKTKLPRLLRVMTLIRSKVGRTIGELARELEVAERTIYRDLEDLRRAGVPCQLDAEPGGYRIGGDFFLPPMQLNLGEAMALSVLVSELAHGKSRLPFLEDAWRAITKIRSQLPSAVRDDVAELGDHVRVDGARVSPQAGNDRQFELIRRAIAEKRKVRCVYAAGRTAGKPFLFRPYALYFGQRAWYAIGLHEGCDQERSLKLNRFRSLEPTDRPYAIPDGWAIERSFGKAWRMIRGPRSTTSRSSSIANAAPTSPIRCGTPRRRSPVGGMDRAPFGAAWTAWTRSSGGCWGMALMRPSFCRASFAPWCPRSRQTW